MACLVSIEPMSITFRTRIATATARMTYRHTARIEQSRDDTSDRHRRRRHPDRDSAALAVELLMVRFVPIEPFIIKFHTRSAAAMARMTHRHTARVEQSRVEPVIVIVDAAQI